MQPMIGRDAVITLLDHRLGICRNHLRRGIGESIALTAQIKVLEEIKGQIDLILPVALDPKLVEVVRV